MADDGMDEIVQEFLVESYENLDQLDQDLVSLESDPTSRDLLSSIFRTVHTIKGTSGFLGYGNLERVSHQGENLLAELRDGKRQMDQPTTDVLLMLVDTLRATLAEIEAGNGDSYDVEPTIARIKEVQDGQATAAQETPPADVPPAAPPQEPAAEVPDTQPAPKPEPEPVARPARKIVRKRRPKDAPVPAPAQNAAAPEAKPAKAGAEQRSAAESSIRVDVDLLDTLMRQVGELVLARNQIDALVAGKDDSDLASSAQRLSLIASELQEGVMKTRMQPIEHVWNKMPRIVRDLSASLGRKVKLQMVGGDTELDRSLLEAVKDPLTHLVRNAVDHGIEDPAERVASGKPETGTITLRAYHAGGQVVVEISDDGHGIDPDAIATKAIAKGLRTEEQVRALAPQDVYELLFLPGFSTAEQVTNVSGRGVGMDVVRTNVQDIGGSVDVESEVGVGTTWRMRIPLTLAIMPSLTVACGDHTLAISQANLLELVAVDAGQVEYVGTAPVYRLRGNLLPLVSLAEVFGMPAQPATDQTIAVLQADEHRFGLLVDRVLNNEEIVVKALPQRIKQVGIYSGATVLGDGTVALILDIPAIARRCLSADTTAAIRDSNSTGHATGQGLEQMLVVAVADRHVAMPLAAVTRLERMPADSIENVGRREVIQYRGELLPVIRLATELGAFSGEPDDGELVVVIAGGGRVAVVVTEVVDIVDDDPAQRSSLDDHGLVGSTVVRGRVTEILDIEALLGPYLAEEMAAA